MHSEIAPSIQTWIADLKPLRTLIVAESGDAERESPIAQLLETQLGQDRGWEAHIPHRWRPVVETAAPKSLSDSHVDPEAGTYDLAVCLESIAQLPLGAATEAVDALRRKARFVICSLPIGRTDGLGWSVRDWQRLEPLAVEKEGDRLLLLLRGGMTLSDDFFRQSPKIWYIAPNRQIYGGVKILYNHVAILNSMGIPALIGTTQRLNQPAQWFAWNPAQLCFSGEAIARIGREDTVVIPEFQHRHVYKYMHAKRRLLFAQNPGLCKDIDQWARMGYDGVLTLNIPDGRRSQLHEFLAPKCPLPIFPISNHYSDDHWGKTSARRVPGRILCLPRKGKEYVDRLDRDFGGVHRVDNMHQIRMGTEYAAADIYVHTGFPEGQPMPPIEAMLSGCVVCGFTGQGGKDVMVEGETGYLADDGDYEQLAAALKRAIEDPNRERVRAAGTRLARMFTRRATAEELNRCYRDWAPALPPARPSLLSKLRRGLAMLNAS